MRLKSESFGNGAVIPGEFCFAVIAPKSHTAPGKNRNPHLAWSDAPAGAKSFALICHDPDVPSRFDEANKEGRKIPASLPRVNFYHWLLWDIPASTREIAAGSQSDGITPHGKNGPEAPGGMRHGINNYSGREKKHYGYDGPCPPWNDSIIHHYHFTIYALDVERLDVKGEPTAENVKAALKGHVLGEASVMGTYSLNPAVSG
ncbi:YbhB/YbcL family Raf kinase inhibitor-like protein [Edaphobacter bradus]|uniref:YbhB/YbcL family Raf kinase inhibitor-like protein n=1 Tax=Edaphobacter bradus TaxID=2259016 RepID=UPI0021E06D9C|nr:YbhB/YbcL family Raf kinase inhibitor-like protein [Edaphobacter bradus]